MAGGRGYCGESAPGFGDEARLVRLGATAAPVTAQDCKAGDEDDGSEDGRHGGPVGRGDAACAATFAGRREGGRW